MRKPDGKFDGSQGGDLQRAEPAFWRTRPNWEREREIEEKRKRGIRELGAPFDALETWGYERRRGWFKAVGSRLGGGNEWSTASPLYWGL